MTLAGNPQEQLKIVHIAGTSGQTWTSYYIATLLRAGYQGWWELVIFSDDGIYGTALPGSYWAMPPRNFLAQAKKAFDESYARASGL